MRENHISFIHHEKLKKFYYSLKLTIYNGMLLGDQESSILIEFKLRKVIKNTKFKLIGTFKFSKISTSK